MTERIGKEMEATSQPEQTALWEEEELQEAEDISLFNSYMDWQEESPCQALSPAELAARVQHLRQLLEQGREEAALQLLWQLLAAHAGTTLTTHRGLAFSYRLRGYEIFFSRRQKSITRSSVLLSLLRLQELHYQVRGPKTLGTFGASYLLPIFLHLGLATLKK